MYQLPSTNYMYPLIENFSGIVPNYNEFEKLRNCIKNLIFGNLISEPNTKPEDENDLEIFQRD